MECDCLGESACTASSAQCHDENNYFSILFPGLWPVVSSVYTAMLALLGFAAYLLPHGLISLWIGLRCLHGAIHKITKAMTWLSHIWRFFAATLRYAGRCVDSFLPPHPNTAQNTSAGPSSSGSTASSTGPPPSSSPPPYSSPLPPSAPPSLIEPGMRLLLLGPSGGGRSQLADALLGCTEHQRGPCSLSTGPLTESVRRQALVDGRVVSVVDTPDLLGSGGGCERAAKEALRSLQLCGPGPHSVLLVVRAPGAAGHEDQDQDAALALRLTMALFGEGVARHVFMVLTHGDGLAPGQTLATLLGANAGGLRAALSLCGLRAELVDNSLCRPPEDRRRMCVRLWERLEEMRALRSHFIHEIQEREDRLREEMLTHMSSDLAGKLQSMLYWKIQD